MPSSHDILERLRLEFEAREAELNALNELNKLLLDGEASLHQTLQSILDSSLKLVGGDFAQVLMRHQSCLTILASSPPGLEGKTLDPTTNVTGYCLLNRKIVNVANVRTDPTFGQRYRDGLYHSTYHRTPHVLSELAIPIVVGEASIGVINLESVREAYFDQRHEQVLSRFAQQASLAFKKLQLFDAAEVFDAVRPLLPSVSHFDDGLLQGIIAKAVSPLETYLGSPIHFQILFRDGNELVVAFSSLGKDLKVRVNVASSVSGEAVLNRSYVLVPDVLDHPKYVPMLGVGGYQIRSELAVPVWIEDEIDGVINLESDRPQFFDMFSVEIVKHFSTQIAWILTLLKLRSELQARERQDSVNRAMATFLNESGNLLHRINNFLGAIRMNAEEIQRYCGAELEMNPLLKKLVNEIHAGATAATALPAAMKRLVADDEWVGVTEIASLVLEHFGHIEGSPGREAARLSLAPYSVAFKVRCPQLGSILVNLVQNAIDAMPLGGDILISSSKISFGKKQYGLVKVSDTGVGMDQETMRRAFDWGYSNKAGIGKGLGWGLPWLKTFVESVGGVVSVESTKGVGSTFTLRFPLAGTEVAVSPAR